MSKHQKIMIVGLLFVVVSLFVLSKKNVTRPTDSRRDDVRGCVKYRPQQAIVQPSTATTDCLWIDTKIRDQDDHPEMAPNYVSESVTSQSNDSTCTPVTDVVYIKTHKTASSTLQNIFYRFGDERDLTFMLPVEVAQIQGITKFEPASVMQPPPGKRYNILANHARFFYEDFKKIMPVDTKFVTVIREAASHLSSMYSYFHLKRQYKVELEEFSLEPKFYFEKYDLNETKRRSGRDQLLFDLGFEKKDMYNVIKVDDYIQFLDEKMDLVLLTEYFLESLILLKDLMCWDMQTIVHLNIKVRVPFPKETEGATSSDTNSARADDALTNRLNEWNAGDFKLYDHFNRTLWQKVDAYGRDRMASEIAELKELCRRYESECMSGTSVNEAKKESQMRSRSFGLKEYVLREENAENMTCKRLGMTSWKFLRYLQEKHTNTMRLRG